ncbi:MAG: DUF4906 domain-containing protein [Bacteroides sp.]|nr:DUF4906 domain-containing protein [Bacteroides sp.]
MMKLFEHPVHREVEEPVPFCWKVLVVAIMAVVLLLLAIVCVSCEERECPCEEQNATIRIEVDNPEISDIVTRAVPSVTIQNLHILIYDSNHELLNKAYGTSNTISIDTRSGSSYTIYAIANTGKADLFDGRVVAREDDLKKMVQSITSWNQLNLNNIVLVGSRADVTVQPGVQTLNDGMTVALTAAQINLNIGIKEGSGITISSYELYNLPTQAYYLPNPEDATNMTTVGRWTGSGVINAGGVIAVNTTFYMFENRRGINSSITAQKDKISAKAPAKATYVEIKGKVGTVDVTWRVYLGKNNASDFNIERNSNYTINITLNDAAMVDTRVTIGSVNVTDLSVSGTANCYLASRINTWYKFKATVRGNGAKTSAIISPTGNELPVNAAINPVNVELVWETNGHRQVIQGLSLTEDMFISKQGLP